MGSIRSPEQYCFAIIAAMGSIQNPKQYCFAISSITTHKVLTSWMHEAPHWKCQCRILTARTSGHGKKMCRPWSQLAGNMPGHLALIRGNESHIGDYNLIFFVLFFVVWIVVTVSVTRQSPIYICIYIILHNHISTYPRHVKQMVGAGQLFYSMHINNRLYDQVREQVDSMRCRLAAAWENMISPFLKES